MKFQPKRRMSAPGNTKEAAFPVRLLHAHRAAAGVARATVAAVATRLPPRQPLPASPQRPTANVATTTIAAEAARCAAPHPLPAPAACAPLGPTGVMGWRRGWQVGGCPGIGSRASRAKRCFGVSQVAAAFLRGIPRTSRVALARNCNLIWPIAGRVGLI